MSTDRQPYKYNPSTSIIHRYTCKKSINLFNINNAFKSSQTKQTIIYLTDNKFKFSTAKSMLKSIDTFSLFGNFFLQLATHFGALVKTIICSIKNQSKTHLEQITSSNYINICLI